MTLMASKATTPEPEPTTEAAAVENVETVQVKHPTLAGVERQVPKAHLADWLEQGWVE